MAGVTFAGLQQQPVYPLSITQQVADGEPDIVVPSLPSWVFAVYAWYQNVHPIVSEYDYIIGNSGSTYIAYFGVNSTVAYSGTNATTIIQSCINQNSSIFMRSGIYPLETTLDFSDTNSSLTGSGFDKTILQYNGTIIKIAHSNGASYFDNEISNLDLDGVGKAGYGIQISNLKMSQFSDIYIHNCNIGIYMRNQTLENIFVNIWIYECNIGVKMLNYDNAGGENYHVDYNKFYGGRVQSCTVVNINITGNCEHNTFDSMLIAGNDYDTSMVYIAAILNTGETAVLNPLFTTFINCWFEVTSTADGDTMIYVTSLWSGNANYTTFGLLIDDCSFHTPCNITFIHIHSGYKTIITNNRFYVALQNNIGTIQLDANTGGNYGAYCTILTNNVGWSKETGSTLTLTDNGHYTVTDNNIWD